MKTYQSQSKRSSRELNFQAYRNLTGLRQIPKHQQYWTLCGPSADTQGNLLPGCELDHVRQSGLLHDLSQFHGVEREGHVHALNAKLRFPRTAAPHFHLGDLEEVLEEALADGNFEPAIVNLDTLSGPKSAVALLGPVLNILNHAPRRGPLMVALNIILERKEYGQYSTFKTLVEAVQQDVFCRTAIDKGWVEATHGNSYESEGRSRTTMGTNIYFRPAQEAALAG